MAPQAPSLPTKFPCWCRAVYSWGGETKRDLGFVEGDLIECLNAGDGAWWTGRLRRDKRMVGLFPSNFVELLGDNYVPGSRSVSPMPAELQRMSSSTPRKQKTVFRKPFQGYKEAVGPSEALRQAQKSAVLSSQLQLAAAREKAASKGIKGPSTRHRESVSRPSSRARSPAPPPAPAPAPAPPPAPAPAKSQSPPPPPTPVHAPAPAPIHDPIHDPIPVPSQALVPISMAVPDRQPSPTPPPPPPHRIAVRSQPPLRNSPSPAPMSYDMVQSYPRHSRTPSPSPQSPAAYGHTPSPLRDAMEDVMSSLQDMGLPRDAPSPEPRRSESPFQPWSPEAFDHLPDHAMTAGNRPLTSLGLGGGVQGYEDDPSYESQHNMPDRYYDGPPQLGNYVQRMESRLRQLHAQSAKDPELHLPDNNKMLPPTPPAHSPGHGRHQSDSAQEMALRKRRSAYELGKNVLGRTFTMKSSATNSSSGLHSNATNGTASTGITSQSLMSGPSAGGFSATSAGSFARRGKPNHLPGHRPTTSMDHFHSGGYMDHDGNSDIISRPSSAVTGISYHSSHNSSRQGATSAVGWEDYNRATDSTKIFGGLTTPKTKKTGIFKKIIESAKTGAATARSNIAASQNGGRLSPTKGLMPGGISSIAQHRGRDVAREMGLSANVDWVQVRRDVNRSTSPSRHELVERAERCQMLDYPVIYAVEELYEGAEGDEGIDGLPIAEPTNWAAINLQLVDKSARFINSLPPMTNPMSLAQGYVCRPHRSDVQRLRAIFTWVGEKIAWDDDIGGEFDLRKVIQMRRGSAQEVAALVMEMCDAVGLHAEVVQGYLKAPGEQLDLDSLSRPNHWWNAVLIDGEWRIMDCSLASPTHPRRSLYSMSTSHAAEGWYFLARPMEICYTHVPTNPEHQHICPPISPDILLALPCACPPFFKNGLGIPNFDTSLVRINDLEAVQIRIHVPPDVECAAEVEALAFARDADGDFFESGDVVKKRALAQADWIDGEKRFTIKAVLPSDEGQGVLKVYAGKKGLMHSSKDIPHALAFALPIIHTGENPPYDFLLRHPTPHAQRHDLYVVQPQCARLAVNNTFVFAVRQHPASRPSSSPNPNEGNGISGRVSPNPFARPSSALSMVSSITGSNASTSSYSFSASSSNISSASSKQGQSGREKPAKLAVQSPSGKIIRLTRKSDHVFTTSNGHADHPPGGSMWETVIKVTERGVWRGLVLADRTARWCVWGEWECF
ncbi:hypothetical protein AJ80_01114 [Polytolypa hystricis UAMH7299]|uniref:SH3 domain-containing protein n=1 Tax=Polytolypa hystricis (strain UAMH7299) TaxID=1447883 RepID=A0A2B7Z2U5_POLH7|nr:hypothetical protein AJ80_01114 [Polytolypa hystricis UAMH7299]